MLKQFLKALYLILYSEVGRGVTAAAVCGLRGLIKEAVLALEKVRPEPAYITCCLRGDYRMAKMSKKIHAK
jgi:hypothetical protein